LLLADCTAAEIQRREGRKADALEALGELSVRRGQVSKSHSGGLRSPAVGSAARPRAKTEGDVCSTWPLSAAAAAAVGLVKDAETTGRVETPETQDGDSSSETDGADDVGSQDSQENLKRDHRRRVRSLSNLQEAGIYDDQLSTAALGLSPGGGHRLPRPGKVGQDQNPAAPTADEKIRLRTKDAAAKPHKQATPLNSPGSSGTLKSDKLPPLGAKWSDDPSSPAMSVPATTRSSGNGASDQRRSSLVISKQERAEAPRYQRPTISSASVMPASSRPGSSCGLEQISPDAAPPLAAASGSALASSPLRISRSRRLSLDRSDMTAFHDQHADQGVPRSSSEPFFVSKAYAPVERNAEHDTPAKFRRFSRGLPAPPRAGSGPGSAGMMSSEKLRGHSLLTESSPTLSPVRRPSPLFDGPWHRKEPVSKATLGSLLPAVDVNCYKPAGDRFRPSMPGVSLAANFVKGSASGARPANDHNFLR